MPLRNGPPIWFWALVCCVSSTPGSATGPVAAVVTPLQSLPAAPVGRPPQCAEKMLMARVEHEDGQHCDGAHAVQRGQIREIERARRMRRHTVKYDRQAGTGTGTMPARW
jgi:hypothetical protein